MRSREKVLNDIINERNYQDGRFGTEFDKLNTIGHWIIYIEEYLSQAKKKFFGSRIPGGVDFEKYSYSSVTSAEASHDVHRREILNRVKKIAALAVACLEYLGEE